MWPLLLFTVTIPPLISILLCSKSQRHGGAPESDKQIKINKSSTNHHEKAPSSGQNQPPPQAKAPPAAPSSGISVKSPSFSIPSESNSDESHLKDNRSKWAYKITKTKCRTLSQEYTEKLKKYVAPNQTYDAHNNNPQKNRYSDVLCADQTRVILKGSGNGYIHASWLTAPGTGTKYICTQGPLQDTCEDFWCMVFQERTKLVIMLCTLVEGDIEKCVVYWPQKKGEEKKYGSYKVKNVEIKDDPVPDVRLSMLDLTFKGETFQVQHLYVSWWPDQLAPTDPVPMVALYKWVKSHHDGKSPILVHCSAGVGRTATFIGIEYATARIQENPCTNLIDVVKEMRAQRYQAIQSHVQFLYLHICLLEYFYQEGVVKKQGRVLEFIEEYQRHADKKLARRKREEGEGG